MSTVTEQLVFNCLLTSCQLLICAKMSPDNRHFGIRRVDFANRFSKGLRLYYLSPSMNLFRGVSKYGNYCVLVNLPVNDADVALKFDSLIHYYNEKNEFDESSCYMDILPVAHMRFLLSNRYSAYFQYENEKVIRQIIEDDPEPIEILSTTKINASSIKGVVVSFEEFNRLTELNKKIPLGLCDSKGKEDLQNYLRLQRELMRKRIKLDIAKRNDQNEMIKVK